MAEPKDKIPRTRSPGRPLERTQTGTIPRYHRIGPARKVVLPTLRVAAGLDMLRYVTLQPGEGLVIGRDDDCDLILLHTSVSRRHARVECEADGTVNVRDLGSTNGSAINGQAIDRGTLRPGDNLEVGAVALRLELLSMEEITHLANVVARLDSATRDPLTGLLTRAWLDDDLPEVLDRSTREGFRLCALFLDLDHFREVNRRFGHGVGDEALRAVARLVMLGVREGDACVRYGGEEILVVVEQGDLDQGLDVAERMRNAIHSHDWTRTASGLEVSVSIGVAERANGEGAREWLERADRALYAAKEAGRNRVERAAAS